LTNKSDASQVSIFAEERAIQRVGSVEPDVFVINDITLNISPEQIHVDKQSFNHEWQTLRTRSAQKVKSGHSIARVSLSIPFIGNDINNKLTRLIAGLRATPFASVYNHYLTNILTGDQPGVEHNSASSTIYNPQGFKPIVLAFSSGQITTMGHEGKPNCIGVELNFMWFNYFPFTPIWAYKTGPTYEVPGYAWQSVLWKKFYEPFYSTSQPVSWPHSSPPPVTSFMWREYAMGLKGSVLANEAAIDLLQTILKNPAKFVKEARDILWARQNKSLAENDKLFDVLYNKSVHEGWNADSSMRQKIGDKQVAVDPSVKAVGEGLINRIGQKSFKWGSDAAATTQLQSTESKNIQEAIALLKKKITTQQELSQGGFDEEQRVAEDNFSKLSETDIKYGDRSEQVSSQFTLLGRKKWLRLDQRNQLNGQKSVIQQISLSFNNTLAPIPMAGYRYPTFQHICSADAEVTFVMNVSNDEAGYFNKMYDEVENMALRFRQVPAPFHNLVIDNDFLKLFNLSEFVSKDIVTDTIPGQPGRSRVVLTLSAAGITSKDKLGDGEQIEQEYIAGDVGIMKEIWKVADKNLAYTNKEGKKITTTIGATDKEMIDRAFIAILTGTYSEAIRYSSGGSFQTKNIELDATTENSYRLYPSGISAKKEDQIYKDLVYKLAVNYNAWSIKVHDHVFADMGTFGRSNFMEDIEEAAMYKAAILSLKNDSQLGFVPGVDKLIAGIQKREQAYLKSSPPNGRAGRPPNFKDYKGFNKIKQETTRLKHLKESGDQQGTDWKQAEIQKTLNDRVWRLNQMGLQDYLQTQSALLRKIISDYIALPQFQHLEGKVESLGLNKGIMAYPDFKEQIQSIAGLLPNTKGSGDLLRIDPDVYMWYPAYSGTAGIDSIIDQDIIRQAQNLSEKVFQNARGDVSNFFAGSYMKMIGGLSSKAPQLKLLSEGGPILAQDLYSASLTYENSLRDPAEPITKSLLIDPASKTHIHIPTQGVMQCDNVCTHTFDFLGMWSGTSSGVNSQQPVSSASKDISGLNKHDKSSSNSFPAKAGNVKGVEPNFTPNWSSISSQSESAKDPTYGYYCPVASLGSLSKAGCCAPRDVGSTVGITSDAFEGYRRQGAVTDWAMGQQLMGGKLKGYVSPTQAETEARQKGLVNKPWSQWTLQDYRKWSVGTKRGQLDKNGRFSPVKPGVAYLHKGLDINSIDKKVGTPIYSIADGVVREAAYYNGAGWTVGIAHSGQGPVKYSRYCHLQAIEPHIKKGVSVKGGQCIAVEGRSGQKSMGVHLHFETWASYPQSKSLLDPLAASTCIPWNVKGGTKNITRYTPPVALQKSINNARAQDLSTNVTTTLSSPMVKAIQDFEMSMLQGQTQSLNRAYPTFKLYFIEDDSGDRKRLAYDDFFSYNSVKSIRVIRSRKIAADLAEIYLTNVSGILSNRKFRHQKGDDRARTGTGQVAQESSSAMDADTAKENPIASFLLQEGMHISLRLGYSSDPDMLDTVFNGIITEVQFSDNEDLVRLVAQSYAVELVQDIKGFEEPKKYSSWSLFGWDFMGLADNASTARILEEVISEPEVLHFGRWSPYSAGTGQRDLLTNKWQWVANPADDNIFAPPRKDDLENLSTGWIVDDLKYTIYRTTIWDIFQEMTLRHPNFIASPVPYKDLYGERMTMFFGLPNQLYFARYPSAQESLAQQTLIQTQDETLKKWAAQRTTSQSVARVAAKALDVHRQGLANTIGWLGKGSIGSRIARGLIFGPGMFAMGSVASTISSSGALDKGSISQKLEEKGGIVAEAFLEKNTRLQRKQAALGAGFIKPFRNYHLLTSDEHIIANNIRTNSRDVANTIVIRYGEAGDKPDSFGNKVAVKEGSQTYTLKLDNALPTEEIRTQEGQFVNVTNVELAKRYALGLLCRNIKETYKGDIQIIGNGKIKPYDVCYICDKYTDMIGPIEVEQVTHIFDQESGFRTEIKPDMVVQAAEWSLLSTIEAMGVVAEGTLQTAFKNDYARLFFAPGTYMVTTGLGLSGGFLAQKILTYTQMAQPVIMSPLTLHGRIFTGGVPIRKIPLSIWETTFGDWSNVSDQGFHEWLNDIGDEIVQSVMKTTGQYSVGNFWSNDND